MAINMGGKNGYEGYKCRENEPLHPNYPSILGYNLVLVLQFVVCVLKKGTRPNRGYKMFHA